VLAAQIPGFSRQNREFCRFSLRNRRFGRKKEGQIKPLRTNSRSRPNREFAPPNRAINSPNRELTGKCSALRIAHKSTILPRKLAFYVAPEEKEFGRLPQFLDQRSCRPEIDRREPLGESITDRREKVTGLFCPALARHSRARLGRREPGSRSFSTVSVYDLTVPDNPVEIQTLQIKGMGNVTQIELSTEEKSLYVISQRANPRIPWVKAMPCIRSLFCRMGHCPSSRHRSFSRCRPVGDRKASQSIPLINPDRSS
jgi:hypothetical protein